MADLPKKRSLSKYRKELLYGEDQEAWENAGDATYLEWQKKYYEQKAKDPNFTPFAGYVKIAKPQKSLFAQSRPATITKKADNEGDEFTILIGNIVEKHFDAPKTSYEEAATTTQPKSLFARSYLAKTKKSKPDGESDAKVRRLGDTTGKPPKTWAGQADSGDACKRLNMCAKKQSIDDLMQEVQRENDETLSEAQILGVQAKLLQGLDPQLLAAFKRKAEVPSTALNAQSRMSSVESAVEPMEQLTKEQSLDGILQEVQQENNVMLSTMSDAQILKARAELLQEIDPQLLAAFKRKAEMPSTALHAPPCMSSVEPAVETIEQLTKANTAFELLERSREHNWVHFDIVEHEKLDWMREISLKAKKLKPDEKFEARFDFKGVLLPYTIADSEEGMAKAMQFNRELFFHADERNRAGYTMQELFRLARSDVLQQRTAAFGAIGGMLNIYNQGFYDRVLDIPLAKIFFLLRFGFDDNMPAMLECVSKALAALFYNDTDEILLDYMFDNPNCAWQPLLAVGEEEFKAEEAPNAVEAMQTQFKTLDIGENKSAKAKNVVQATVKQEDVDVDDYQLAETDLVKCALRTNILQRIWFILHQLRPNNSIVTSCLKLLIRFARSGPVAAKQIFNFDELMKTLRENFIPELSRLNPQSSFYLNPQPLCIKLFRVLASQSTAMADGLSRHGLIETLLDHMHVVQNINANLCKIQTEIMRLLRVLVTVGSPKQLSWQFVKQLHAMIPWHINYKSYVAHTPLSQRMHGTSLVALICCYIAHNQADFYGQVDVLYDLCCSTFHQANQDGATTMSQINFLNVCLDAALLCIQRGHTKRMASFINGQLKDFIESKHFLAMVERLSSTSLILSPYFDRSQIHEPLPNVGAIIMHETGPSLIMSEQYATHLLKTVFHLMDACEGLAAAKARAVLLRPAVTSAISQYIGRVGRRINRTLTANFFAKRELQFIFQLLVAKSLKVPLKPEDVVRCAYNLASCLGTESVSQLIELLRGVLFNPEYIQAPEQTLNKWADCFIAVVMPSLICLHEADLTLNLPYRSPGVMPSDWLFSYIKDVLRDHLENIKEPSQQSAKANTDAELKVFVMTYEYWRLLELASPELRVCSPTEILMYLMISFFGRESCFLDMEFQFLLEERIMGFFEEYKDYQFQFNVVFDGKCSFENLYILFTNHFISDSYADNLFAALLMVPQAMKYDVKYRKMLWSEYVPALTYIRCSEKMLMGGFEAYIKPVETDESLILEYSTVLKNQEVAEATLTYKIAKHHLTHCKALTEKPATN